MAEGDDGTPLQVIGGVDTGAGFFGDGMVDSTADTVVSMGLSDRIISLRTR